MQRRRWRALGASLILTTGVVTAAVGSSPLEVGAAPISFGVVNVPAGDAMTTPGYFRLDTLSATGTNAGFTINMSAAAGGPAFALSVAPKAGGTIPAGSSPTAPFPVVETGTTGTATPTTARLVIAQGEGVCSNGSGEYRIDDIAFGGVGGAISRLAMTWSLRCLAIPAGPLSSGVVHLNQENGPIGNPAASEFYPVDPARLFESRRPAAGLGAGATADITVVGVAGVPATATAVVLNVTAVSPTLQTFLTVYPAGAGLPLASNVNPAPDDIVANLTTVKVGAGGKVTLFNSVGVTGALVDIVGYYAPEDATTAGGRFFGQTPARLLDTRNANAPFGPGETREITVDATATAAVLNVTSTLSTQASYLTVFPQGGAVPEASNLNFSAGQNLPNLVVVKLTAGKASIFNSVGSTHVVVDVVGVFKDGIPILTKSGRFIPVDPVRAYDTRDPKPQGSLVTVALAAAEARDVDVLGLLKAYHFEYSGFVANVTVTQTTADYGFLTVFPTGAARPNASNLNWRAAETRPNLAMTATDGFGFTSYYNDQGTTDLIIDVAGWFTR